MLLSFLTLTLFSLSQHISHVSATVYARSVVDAPVLGHTGWIDSRVRARADVILNHVDYKVRNVDSTGFQAKAVVSASPTDAAATPTPFSTSPPMDNGTDAACLSALSSLNGQASSATGISVCYNLAYFNNSTGTFQADVRLYRLNPPSGDWASLVQASASVGLIYPNAAVAMGTNMNGGKSRVKRQLLSPDNGALVARAAPPKVIATMTFVGQLDSSQLSQAMNDTALRNALTPTITLSGVTQNGMSMNTTLSNREASFVHGVFSNQQAATSPSAAQTTQFVLPGTTLGIFPVSLIVTGVWALLFIGAVGYGTVGRIQFRNSYRRRARLTGQDLGWER